MKHKLLFLILGAIPLAFPSSCSKEDPNRERDEKIEIFPSKEAMTKPGALPVSELGVDVRGGEAEFYIRSNVEITASWQDSYSSPWAEVVSCEKLQSMDDVYLLKLKVTRLSSSCNYTKRVGTLLLNNKAIAFAKFVRVYQGLTARLNCDFSYLLSGSDDPRSESGDQPILSWPESLKSTYRFTSTPFAGGDIAYCFGKKGYIRLGDNEGHGADITSWFVEDIRKDSLLMVSFKAVAYAGIDGKKDANKLTVEVSGGGEIRDFLGEGVKKIVLDAPYLNANDSNVAKSMWKNSNFLVFIAGTKSNPLTSNTRVTFSVGDLRSTGAPDRIFIDEICINTVNPKLEEDYFKKNEGSGKDRILGIPSDSQIQ